MLCSSRTRHSASKITSILADLVKWFSWLFPTCPPPGHFLGCQVSVLKWNDYQIVRGEGRERACLVHSCISSAWHRPAHGRLLVNNY